MSYSPPLETMWFVLECMSNYPQISDLPGNEDFDGTVAVAVLEEASKIAQRTLHPLNRAGDVFGAKLVDGKVRLVDGSVEAHKALAEGGWIGLAENPEYGGQGAPDSLSAAVSEIWHGANPAFALCNMLTRGAIRAIELCGSSAQKSMFLPKLIDGSWTGTMNITEPQAGSNLAAIRTMARQDGEHYRITGQKIFITHGEHDLAENILHLVLARTPDAPDGIKGLSLFAVPKFLVDPKGSLGGRNEVACVSLEGKLGIHASPTAVLSFGDADGAIGYLLGEQNRGIEYMFAMMNEARFEVGVQALGIADAATQVARSYAADRKQGTAIGQQIEKSIDWHPDVKRMLLNMKSRVAAMRAVAYFAAGLRDMSRGTGDRDMTDEFEFLIPIVKGWLTETCQQVTYDAIQIHGGWGFIEETGVAQFARDARITSLYEGTTGIQAADLTFRKTARDGGATARRLLDRLAGFAANDSENGSTLLATIEAARRFLDWLVDTGRNDPVQLAATADTYLRAIGTLLGGVLLSRLACEARIARPDTEFACEQAGLANHFVATFLPVAAAHFDGAPAAARPVTEFEVAWL